MNSPFSSPIRPIFASPGPPSPTPPVTDSLPPGLYIHVPFCKTKCPYCDFYSVTDLSLVGRWIEAIALEAARYHDDFGVFDSIYLGGGTPSLLDGRSLGTLMETLRRSFVVAPGAEITVEVNPDDVTAEGLDLFTALGVNRLSIGVQSLRDSELRFLKRRHDAAAAERAVTLARGRGFTNLGIDLMYGLPGQTLEEWADTLEKGISLGPNHLSCYQLTLHSGTPYGRLRAEGRLAALPEEQERDFFLFTSRFLKERGYIHYEVSNFARERDSMSRHNTKYWKHSPYLGLGPSAHSFLGGRRWWNVRSVEVYCTALEAGRLPVEDGEYLSPDQLRLERLFLGFRTEAGVALADIFSQDPSGRTLVTLVEQGLVCTTGDSVVPTEEGFLLADRLPLLIDEPLP
jgi:putative oxygen-independent coproporphyrinogen III oxidase